MIRPRPNTDPARALALIAATPGEESIESLASHLFPPPRPAPFRTWADRQAFATVRTKHTQASREKTSRIVRRLAEAGYLEARTGPRVAAWFLDRMARDGLPEALRMSGPRHHASLRAIAPTGELAFDGYHEGPGLLHARLIHQVADMPPTVADVIGSKPSGRVTKVWAQLVRWGVVIPPSARFPTAKALDLLASWALPCN